MRKHNFMPEDFKLKEDQNIKKRFCVAICIIVVFNLFFLYRLYRINEELKKNTVSVFGYKKSKIIKDTKSAGVERDIKAYEIYKFINSSNKEIRIENLECQGKKALVTITASDRQKSINFLNRIDSSGKFQIEGMEPKDDNRKGYSFNVTIIRKE